MGEYLSTPNKAKHSSEGEIALVSLILLQDLVEIWSLQYAGVA
jgi:hypothetical protein